MLPSICSHEQTRIAIAVSFPVREEEFRFGGKGTKMAELSTDKHDEEEMEDGIGSNNLVDTHYMEVVERVDGYDRVGRVHVNDDGVGIVQANDGVGRVQANDGVVMMIQANDGVVVMVDANDRVGMVHANDGVVMVDADDGLGMIDADDGVERVN
ncbi:hypothetical protein V8G54_015746 [Vigna mungo]|uniref:Uncharacterized protein n=1 Tax=Vigna mungo TaxID=3915 RepID=A0AAQ3NJW7_VIGMU